jgi:hypothetical protein
MIGAPVFVSGLKPAFVPDLPVLLAREPRETTMKML